MKPFSLRIRLHLHPPVCSSIFPVRTIPTLPNAHLVPSPGNPIPMDIDLARRKPPPSVSCFLCRKPRHMSRECPDCFDLRTLSIDELQELLANRLAQLDVAAAPEPTVLILEEPVAEDFPKDDKQRVCPRHPHTTDSLFYL